MGTLASLNVVLTASTLAFTKGLATAEGSLNHFVHKTEGLMNIFGSALNPLHVFHHALDAFSEHETAVAKLEAILHATGDAAGLTGHQMEELAGHLAETTTFSQTATVGAEAMLASFSKINGDVFERAVRVTQDLSAAMGKDLQSAAILVGRALQDPEAGLNRLNRAGVTFTATQKDMIKHLVETGNGAKAQGLILDALEGKIGGVADAMGKTTAGRMQQFHNSLHEVYVLIGEHLKPMMILLTQAAIDGVHWIQQHATALERVARAALLSVAAIEGARLAIKALGAAEKVTATITAFLKALSGPEGWVELAIGVTAAALAVSMMNSALDKVEASAKSAIDAMSGLKTHGAGGDHDAGKGPADSAAFLRALEEQQGRLSGEAAKMWEEALDPAFKYYIQVNRINAVYDAGLINVELYRRALARAYDEYDALGKKVSDFATELQKQIATMGMSANMAQLWGLRMEGLKGSQSIILEGLVRQIDAMEKQKSVMEEMNRLTDEANRLAMGDRDFQLSKLQELGATNEQLERAAFLMDEIARMKAAHSKPDHFSLPGAPPTVSRIIETGGQRASSGFSSGVEKNTAIVAAEAPKQTQSLDDLKATCKQIGDKLQPIVVFDIP